MRNEVSNKRPSLLSSKFRQWAAPQGPLAEWTRHIDGDWVWYCPMCNRVVLLIEEKTDTSQQRAWNVTRRMATGHEDRPWGWRITCHQDGTYTVVGARNATTHDSFGDKTITEDELLRWITRTFEQHYEQQGHKRD